MITIKRIWKHGLCALLSACVAVGILQTRDMASGPGLSVYDAVSVDGSVTLHTEFLTAVDSPESAFEAVSRQANAMSDAQKRNPADVNRAVLFAETAVAAAVRKSDNAPVIHISK
ncbi:MAG: hypothetical protein IJR48_06865, partial [Oscillibacter sp.]|nr:hypothetical protein [Oscillibacter sp.]